MTDDRYYPIDIVFTQTVKFRYRIALTEEQSKIMDNDDIEKAALKEMARIPMEQRLEMIDVDDIQIKCDVIWNEPIDRDALMEEFVPSYAAKDLLKKMVDG